MKQPLVSVVIPVHNKVSHIERSVQSVLNQIYQNFELILVDDASTDGSDNVIDKYIDPRIKKLRREKPGLGGYEARNLGVESANSDWIAFLDADDEWYPSYLENFISLHAKHPGADFFSCGWEVGDEEKKIKNPFFQKHNNVMGDIDLIKYLEIHASGVDIVNTNVAVVRKRKLLEIGGFPIPSEKCKRGGDGQTWLRLMLAGARMVWSPFIGAVYYQDAENMVTKLKIYDIEENGLITYLKEAEKSDCYKKKVRVLLKEYRKRKTVVALSQHVFNGTVTFKILQKAFVEGKKNKIFLAILSGYFFPIWTKSLLDNR